MTEESPTASNTPAQVREERARLLAQLQHEAITAAEAAGHTTSAVDDLIADRRRSD